MKSLQNMSNAIRFLSMDAVEKAKSGHPGMPLGMADVATILFSKFINIAPNNPNWENRDRFVLSAGHGSMLIYSMLYLLGYPDMTIEEIKNFRQFNSQTPGHPEHGHTKGIETTTGPLGQGLSNAVGMALAERMANARFGIVDHYTYVIAGDGCLMEGISQEAISLAGHLCLNKLIVMWDNNKITIDGSTDISTSDNQLERFKASNWNVIDIDGHNFTEIENALSTAKKSDKPTLISCRTIIGYGAPNKQGSHNVHGSPLGADEIANARKHLNWNYPAFEIPADILNEWRSIGENGNQSAKKWLESVKNTSNYKDLEVFLSANIKMPYVELKKMAEEYIASKKSIATRETSFKVLEKIMPVNPNIIGGSADLTPSVKTFVAGMSHVAKNKYDGNYINYGVREHVMGAVMNGIYLYGGFRPYAGTFLVFADYMRPAIRLASLMKLPIIYVLTHDSIGVGEDGPTHQPVETIAGLQVIPNLHIFRPADIIETIEAWDIALASKETPSVLALSRQNLSTIRDSYNENNNLTKKGGYIIKDTSLDLKVCIFACGSELEIAIKAQDILKEKGIGARVISVPCLNILKEQPVGYLESIAPKAIKRAVIDAGVRQNWEYIISNDDIFVGMNSFGASAPIEKLYSHFLLTADNLVDKILKNM